MRQDRFGLGVADAVGQLPERFETVDGDLVARRDLRSQAGASEPIERAMPEGDDIGPHACHLRSVFQQSQPRTRVRTPARVKNLGSDSIRTAGSGPGACGLCLGLIGVDRGLLLHGEADVVETVHQAVLAVRVDLEFHGAAVGPANFLLAEIDAQRRIGAAFGIVEQFVEVVLGDADRQNAVLEAVVVEDIAKRGRDHATDAEIQQRPRRVFAARTTAEIIARDQNFGVAVGRLVEDEIRILAAVILVALFREQPLAKAGALDGFEILLGDDHVGIDIDDLQRRRDALQRGELVHRSHFSGWDYRKPLYPWFIANAAGIKVQIATIYPSCASIASMSASERPKWWPIS